MSSVPATTPASASEAPLYRPGPLARWIYRRFFSHIEVDERWSENVRASAARGVVVHVARSYSYLAFLCLGYLLERFQLPPVQFVNDDRHSPSPGAPTLARLVESGGSALLFLRRPPRRGSRNRKGAQMDEDLILTLVEAQRAMARPLLVVPQTFVWSLLPPRARRSAVDLFFGPVEWPGRLRVFFQFLLNYRNARLRSGEPFDVQAFLAERPDLSDAQAADKIRYALLRRIERERALVLGPTEKTPGRLQEEILRSPRVQELIEATARAEGKPVAKVERQAHKILRRLSAHQTPFVLAVLYRFLDWVWNRIYDGVVVDREGLERLREAARDGAVVFLPSHKSHVDYLVLSYVLYGNALTPPLIAAGDNLSFFPLGPILRRGGAFFIRRSFRGEKLYAALVDAYMRKVLVEGHGLEFFIEGGRSRTGKLLPPKYGLLSMVVDASLMLRARKVRFVPISIGYERIVEERSFVAELSGGEKQSENVSDLLRTSNVLQSRYGRLYVQFGEILSFDDLLAESAGAKPGASLTHAPLSPKARRQLIQRLAHRVCYEINRVTVVTPAALVASALLVHRRRGMSHALLLETARALLASLERAGARIAGQLRDDEGQLRPDMVHEALQLFLDGRLIVRHETPTGAIYTIPDERRIALEYYKNNLVHFFVPYALISAALLAEESHAISLDVLRERVRELSRLFKYEFMYRADADFDRIFDEALGHMLAHGELEQAGVDVRPALGASGRMVYLYATMLRTYFESYLLALRGAALLDGGPTTRKDWIKRCLSIGHTMFLAGELELRESLNKLTLETALKSLKDLDLVKIQGEELALGGAEDPRVARAALEAKLRAFLQ